MKIIKPILPKVGGKQKTAHLIIEHIDITKYNTYIEPFFGMGSVYYALWSKHGSNMPSSFINDIDNNAINMFHHIREHAIEMQRELRLMEYSEALYQKTNPNSEEYKKQSDFKKACWYFYHLSNSYGGQIHGGLKKSTTRLEYRTHANRIERISEVIEPLKNAYISAKDYHRLILERDSKDSFFYFDPPYFGYLGYKTGQIRPLEFANILKGIKGDWVLSHYYDGFIRKFFEQDDKYEVVVLGDTKKGLTSPDNIDCIVIKRDK